MSIRFKSGEFHDFTATRQFQLSTFGVTLQKGDEVQFDGVTVKHADQTYSLAQLKGCITNGWLVPSAEYDEDDANYGRPASANIRVRNAKGDGTFSVLSGSVDDDERVVMNYNDRTKSASKTASKAVSVDDASSEGTVVRTLGPARQPRTVVTPQTASKLIRQAEELAPIVPGKGSSSQIVVEGIKINTHVGSGRGDTEEGVSFTNSVGTDRGTTEEGVSFSKTRKRAKAVSVEAPAAPAQSTVNLNVSRLVAKSICADFPDNYDFAAPERKKIARLQADYDQRPDVIRAVFAAETDAMKARLIEEFPEVFTA